MDEPARASIWLRDGAAAGIYRPSADRLQARLRTISGCARAILAHYGIDPLEAAEMAGGEPALSDIIANDRHLTMTIRLPMPYGKALMTIATGVGASVTLPGMTLSPAIAEAATGRPLGRLTGHPAFDGLAGVEVTRVEQSADAQGRARTILHFIDRAEPIGHGARGGQPSTQ